MTSNWTIETLKEHIEKILIEKDRAIANALAAAKEAVTKAEAAAEKRFESVNEFRNTLSDQQRNLMPRSEAEVKFDSYTKQLDMIISRLDKSEGKGGGLLQGWAILLGVVGLAGGVIGIISYLVK